MTGADAGEAAVAQGGRVSRITRLTCVKAVTCGVTRGDGPDVGFMMV